MFTCIASELLWITILVKHLGLFYTYNSFTSSEHQKYLFYPQKKLVDELEQLRSAGKKAKKRPKKEKEEVEPVKKVEYVEPTDEEDDEFEDRNKDPDWRATPLFKRIQVIICVIEN